MRLVIQRVSKASVLVAGEVVGKIGRGVVILIGVGKEDDEKDAITLAEKTSKLRIMSDANDKMNLSIQDSNAGILAISQFTLFANTKKGNRPSFIDAAEPKKAKKLYDTFVEVLKKKKIAIKEGRFGHYMEIKAKLDGPVTIIIDSKKT